MKNCGIFHSFVFVSCSRAIAALFCVVNICGASPNHIVNDSAQGPLAKTQALENLKKARDNQQDEILKIEKEMKLRISETQTFQVKSDQERTLESKWFNYGESLRILSLKRQEALLKQKMIDQLMFEIDSKWNGQALRTFLEHSFLDMSLGELTDLTPEINRALFYTYMSVAIREVPEKTEDLIGFLIGYMNFSSVSKPRTPLAYLNTRNYSNGQKSVTAKALKSESISQLVEKRLKVVEEFHSSNSKGADSAGEQNSLRATIKPSQKSTPKSKDKGYEKAVPQKTSESDENDTENPDDAKLIRPEDSEQSKPSALIINFAPEKVSEVLLKN